MNKMAWQKHENELKSAKSRHRGSTMMRISIKSNPFKYQYARRRQQMPQTALFGCCIFIIIVFFVVIVIIIVIVAFFCYLLVVYIRSSESVR